MPKVDSNIVQTGMYPNTAVGQKASEDPRKLPPFPSQVTEDIQALQDARECWQALPKGVSVGT